MCRIDADSPAEQSGLKAGDQIVAVNGHSFASILHHEAVAILRAYTTLVITVRVSVCVCVVVEGSHLLFPSLLEGCLYLSQKTKRILMETHPHLPLPTLPHTINNTLTNNNLTTPTPIRLTTPTMTTPILISSTRNDGLTGRSRYHDVHRVFASF